MNPVVLYGKPTSKTAGGQIELFSRIAIKSAITHIVRALVMYFAELKVGFDAAFTLAGIVYQVLGG